MILDKQRDTTLLYSIFCAQITAMVFWLSYSFAQARKSRMWVKLVVLGALGGWMWRTKQLIELDF